MIRSDARWLLRKPFQKAVSVLLNDIRNSFAIFLPISKLYAGCADIEMKNKAILSDVVHMVINKLC
jgi:hypothetical protein